MAPKISKAKGKTLRGVLNFNIFYNQVVISNAVINLYYTRIPHCVQNDNIKGVLPSIIAVLNLVQIKHL
jgi:hypothetical protein